jgi:hypothetical protein
VNIIAVLLLAVLVAGIPAGAEATDLTVTVKGGAGIPQGSVRRYPVEQGRIYHDPRTNIPNRPVAPIVVMPQPVYFSAPQRCVVPGYWAYAWVPQSYAENVWVPSYYNYDAVWVEGHYESRAYTWGYYQPYWVPERAC